MRQRTATVAAGSLGGANPYNARLSRKCWEEGRQDRAANRPKQCPYTDAHRATIRAWGKGWDSMHAQLKAQTEARRPKVEHQSVEVQTRDEVKLWPEGDPMPTHYQKPKPIPCPKCRAHYLASGSQAVKQRTLLNAVGYFTCRSCNHQFAFPVRR